MDHYLVVSDKGPVADLHRRYSEAQAWTKGVGPHPVDGAGGVDEDRVPIAALLVPAQDPVRLVDYDCLANEYLIFCPEVNSASSPDSR